jgi:transcriptional regulator with XRE-family HTH domain
VIYVSPVQRRLVGGALRRYRDKLRYSLEDVAAVLDCDRSKISRIENGQRGIRPAELRTLLAEYGVPDDEQAALLKLTPQGRPRGWWSEYPDALPAGVADFTVLEAAAAELMTYQPQLIPDLLQTRDYARAIADEDPAFTGDEPRQKAVAALTARQTAMLDSGSPIAVVLSEATLHQQVGGPAVMAQQVARLADLASDHPAITLQLLPFTAGAHAASGSGGFTVLRFMPGLGVVHLSALPAGTWLEDPTDVAAYSRAFGLLRAAALSPADTAALLRQMARDIPPFDPAAS